ncbi:MAG TPA: hypothetical protein VFM90_09980 [Cyclobacteriaceae bacterium]|nr:hypothetical protein [Cyclobacteriaceae bacterium]
MSYASAQEITEGKVDYQKKEQPALIMEVPYPPGVVEDAIKDYLNRRGSKANSSRGYQLFKGTMLDSLSSETNDLYFKVERKSRKEKDASVVYLFVTNPNENPTTRVASGGNLSGARSFLRNMLPSLEAHNLEVEINSQADEVKKAEKKYERLIDDGNDMQKRLKKLQENIEENKKDVEKQQQEIEKQKGILESMRGKRKG